MSTRVYIGRLPPDLREDDLVSFFNPFKIHGVNLKGVYGFVEFDSPADADDAVRDFDGKSLMGERIQVQPSRDSRRRDDFERPPPRSFAPPRRGVRISVIGVPERTSWQDLKDFGRNGSNNIMYADMDRTNPRNGIIEFPTMEDAEDAIRRLDGSEINGQRVQLEIVPEGAPDQRDQRDDRRPPPSRDFGYDRRDDRRDDRGGRDDRYAPRHDDRAPRYDDRAPRYDDRAPRQDDRAPRQDDRAPRQDDRAPRQDERAPRRDEGRYEPRRDDRDRSPPRRREEERYERR